MKKLAKNLLKNLAILLIKILSSFNSGRFFIDHLTKSIFSSKKKIFHNGTNLSFFTTNRLNFLRASTFSSKEPETLEWIDNFKKEKIFWDIGANIGLYSCYAAKKIGCKVYSFEPSVLNLELLVKNIHHNSLSNKINLIPFPLFEDISIKSFYLSDDERGSALSNFGESLNHDGKPMESKLSYKTFGSSIDSIIDKLKFEPPHYIKLDVDGIEHLILKGAMETLKNVESILLEVNANYKSQSEEINRILTLSGFKLKEIRQSEFIKDSIGFSAFSNQIWIK